MKKLLKSLLVIVPLSVGGIVGFNMDLGFLGDILMSVEALIALGISTLIGVIAFAITRLETKGLAALSVLIINRLVALFTSDDEDAKKKANLVINSVMSIPIVKEQIDNAGKRLAIELTLLKNQLLELQDRSLTLAYKIDNGLGDIDKLTALKIECDEQIEVLHAQINT